MVMRGNPTNISETHYHGKGGGGGGMIPQKYLRHITMVKGDNPTQISQTYDHGKGGGGQPHTNI